MAGRVVEAETARPGLWARAPDAVARRLARARKYVWQRRRLDRRAPRRAVFLVGCQRSGTNMFLRSVEACPGAWVYNEDARPAFEAFCLREPERIARLIARSPAPVVLFKPLCDSQWTDRLLERHPGSRAVWMFRHWADVANSAVRMWGAHQRETIERIARGTWEELGWRGERLSDASLALVNDQCRDLSDHEGAVLMWALRNRLYFELSLERDPRVLLVRYEDLARASAERFPAVFDFMGLEFDPAFAREATPESIRKEPPPPVRDAIQTAADALLARLRAACPAREWQ